MQKILVLQTKIGQESFSKLKNNDFYKFEKSVCMPSVQTWAKKNNYDYQLITTSSLKFKNNFFPEGWKKIGPYLFERYAYLNQSKYDFIIYIDTDVKINNHSPSFPVKKGVSICLDKNAFKSYSNQERFTEKFKKRIQTNKYYNNGVFCVDTKTALNIQSYMLDKINCNDNTNMHHCMDQDMFNHYLRKSNCKINKLSESWNYLINNDFSDWRADKENKMGFYLNLHKIKKFNTHYFVHFAGEIKKHIGIIKNFIL